MMKYGSTGHFTLPAFSLEKTEGVVRIHTARYKSGLNGGILRSPVALARQSVALQARRQRDVAEGGTAATALQAHLGGLSLDRRGGDDDAVHLHQTGHLLRLHEERGRNSQIIVLSFLLQ